MSNKYILFCAQEANFQTRSMLIPYDLIMKCEERVNDLNILRNYASHNVKLDDHIIDQLIIQNISFEGNCGTYDETPYRKIIHELARYADGMEDDCVFHNYDQEWKKGIIPGIASNGFNHIKNYCIFRNKSEYNGSGIEIIEGFLILQSNNGKLNKLSVDTVEELFTKYYF